MTFSTGWSDGLRNATVAGYERDDCGSALLLVNRGRADFAAANRHKASATTATGCAHGGTLRPSGARLR